MVSANSNIHQGVFNMAQFPLCGSAKTLTKNNRHLLSSDMSLRLRPLRLDVVQKHSAEVSDRRLADRIRRWKVATRKPGSIVGVCFLGCVCPKICLAFLVFLSCFDFGGGSERGPLIGGLPLDPLQTIHHDLGRLIPFSVLFNHRSNQLFPGFVFDFFNPFL